MHCQQGMFDRGLSLPYCDLPVTSQSGYCHLSLTSHTRLTPTEWGYRGYAEGYHLPRNAGENPAMQLVASHDPIGASRPVRIGPVFGAATCAATSSTFYTQTTTGTPTDSIRVA